jgi:hypothetical protein
MHDFTTFEKTIPLYDDNDPIRKHLKKFKCCECNKNKFHIPFDTDDGKTVCIDCIRTGSGHTIVLNDRTIRDLEAVANRINGTDNYPPKETTEQTTTNKGTKMKLIKKLDQRTTKAISKFTVEYPFTTRAILWFFVVLLSGIIYRLNK